MGVKKVPSKEIKACDICGREANYLKKCQSCGKEYCIICDAIIYGCVHKVEVCRKCQDRKEVQVISEKYAPRIAKLLRDRSRELWKLPKENTNG